MHLIGCKYIKCIQKGAYLGALFLLDKESIGAGYPGREALVNNTYTNATAIISSTA
jgi:hypothetical protein